MTTHDQACRFCGDDAPPIEEFDGRYFHRACALRAWERECEKINYEIRRRS